MFSNYFTSEIEIKPQPTRSLQKRHSIILHQKSKSNHNNTFCYLFCYHIILHQKSKSNHNFKPYCELSAIIILHQKSKSNHNIALNDYLVFFIILHQKSKSNHNLKDSVFRKERLFYIRNRNHFEYFFTPLCLWLSDNCLIRFFCAGSL